MVGWSGPDERERRKRGKRDGANMLGGNREPSDLGALDQNLVASTK